MVAIAFGVGACGGDHQRGEPVPPRLALAPVEPPPALTTPLPTPRAPINASPSVAPAPVRVVGQLSVVPTPGLVVDARTLVISADGSDSELAAIQQTLDYLGTPHDVRIANQTPPLTAADLGAGSHGKYNGIILTRGNLILGDGTSAFTNAEFETLATYEATFKVRRVSLYTMPDAGYGYSSFETHDTSALPLGTQCTAAASAVFPYVNCAPGVTIAGGFAYPATPLDAATTALLVDGGGRVLAATRSYANGREALSLNFAQAPSLFHTLELLHGVVGWVTRGVFLGERHAYLGVQVDDFFLPDAIYTGGTYRMTPADLQAAFEDQSAKQAQPTTSGMRYHLAFNGVGAVQGGSDELTALSQQLASSFYWISHTYDHLSLDSLMYPEVLSELTQNAGVSDQLGLKPFSNLNLVTPAITGLGNPDAMRAAVDAGIRYLVSDTSQPGQDNPSPNAGIYNVHQPQILEIPRRPVNLYYNVSTPEEWMAEYNDLYRSFWGRDLTYDEILGHESDVLAQYLLRGENDPWMFHQPNLRIYGSGRSLLGDLLDRTFSKYGSYVTVPLIGPTMEDLGARVADRMAYNASGATGTVDPTAGTITIQVANAATVPVTGACGTNNESYAGQAISYVALPAGGSVTLPLATGEACGGSAALSLPCTNLTVTAGAIGPGQTAAALTSAELTGTADVWTDYVEVFPASQIVCSYDLPAGVAPSALTSLALDVNYRGPDKATMTWTFEVFDNTTGTWTALGDNAFAGVWVWTPQVFALPAPFDRFFGGSRLQIRYGTTSDFDASALDQLLITARR